MTNQSPNPESFKETEAKEVGRKKASKRPGASRKRLGHRLIECQNFRIATRMSFSMYVYLYIYIYIDPPYIYIYVCIYIHTYIHIYIYVGKKGASRASSLRLRVAVAVPASGAHVAADHLRFRARKGSGPG